MRIAIEAQRIFRKNKHGMDFVVLEMVRRLQRMDPANEYYILTAGGEDVCLEESERFHIVTMKCGFYPLWEQVLLPSAVRRIRPDILHCTSNTAPIFPGAPLILTLHDVIFLEKQASRNGSLYQSFGRLYRRLIVPAILSKCRRIVTVSYYEKERIVETAGVDPGRISVVYNGYSPEFKAEGRATGDYILFLGNTDPKKNTVGTFAAYGIYLKRSDRRLPLLVADLSEASAAEAAQEAGCPDIMDHLILKGYIPHGDLPDTYRHASAFLYTSLRESFGIPQLEAMACGTPVVASCTSAIPEVAGDGALMVDPKDPESIADALLRLERDPEFRQRMVDCGLERVKKFSWEETARQVLKIYESEGRS